MTITPLQTTTEYARVEPQSNRLPVLANTINEHLAAAEAATRRGLEHAIAAGILLLEAQELVTHGEWLTWLQANCQIGKRQAQADMRLARNRHRLDALKNAPGAHLTIHAAEALVGRPKPDRPHGLPHQLDLAGSDWEVIAPAVITNSAPARVCAASHAIADLEKALAAIRTVERSVIRGPAGRITGRHVKAWLKHRSRLPVAASMIEATLAFLREMGPSR